MVVGISNGNKNKQVRPVGYCDLMLPFFSSVFIQGTNEHTPQFFTRNN